MVKLGILQCGEEATASEGDIAKRMATHNCLDDVLCQLGVGVPAGDRYFGGRDLFTTSCPGDTTENLLGDALATARRPFLLSVRAAQTKAQDVLVHNSLMVA